MQLEQYNRLQSEMGRGGVADVMRHTDHQLGLINEHYAEIARQTAATGSQSHPQITSRATAASQVSSLHFLARMHASTFRFAYSSQ